MPYVGVLCHYYQDISDKLVNERWLKMYADYLWHKKT